MHWAKVGKLTKAWRHKILATALNWLRGKPIPEATDDDKRILRVIWRAKMKQHLPDKDNAFAALKHMVTDNLRYKRFKRRKIRDPESGKIRQGNVLTPSKVAVIYDDDTEHVDFEYVPEIAKKRELIVEVYEWI